MNSDIQYVFPFHVNVSKLNENIYILFNMARKTHATKKLNKFSSL